MGGGGTVTRLSLQNAGPRQPQAASAHISTRPNHAPHSSLNAARQPMEGEHPYVFLIALFLIHYMTALPQCCTPRADTYFLKTGLSLK